MNYDEFRAKVNKLIDTPYIEKLYHYPDGNKFNSKAAPKFDYAASCEEIGGAHGGSCWGGEAERYTTSDPPDGYGFIDTIIENLFPETTYKTYRKIVAALETFEYNDYAYYGNYTTYRIRWIELKKLYELLCA